MLILSGDIGGTKSRIALIEIEAERVQVHGESTFASADFTGIQEIIKRFMASAEVVPEAVGLGVAGPVREQCCEATNLPWLIDTHSLECSLGLPQLYLLNDLEATAWGIRALNRLDIFELNAGRPDPEGNLSVIAAGTGLGEAGICRHKGGFYPFASEGGHADFAPSNELELALLHFLAQRYGHVSWERVISGMGIPDILEFLCQHQDKEIPATLRQGLISGGGAALIAAADARECPLCAQTMELFVRLYAREAGNHALKIMATGGVYLAGGIAPKILPYLRTPSFLAAFFDKGRMQPLMRDMPVQVILNDSAALYGAALATAHRFGAIGL
jgi:glucokinase